MTLQKFQKLYNETHDICQDLHKKSNYIAIMRFVLGMGVIAGLLVGQQLSILIITFYSLPVEGDPVTSGGILI